MSTMKRIAKHHKFRVLLHEKPYKGINGSGKHNNWSLLTDTGVNLLSPGKNPKSNMQFLVFLVATTKAVLEQEALFKACIVSLGNERRLGGDGGTTGDYVRIPGTTARFYSGRNRTESEPVRR